MHPTSNNSILLTDGRSTVRITTLSGQAPDTFMNHDEPDVDAWVTAGGVLVLQHKDGKVSAVSPTGWTRVSVVR
jgi:hypothetical protein